MALKHGLLAVAIILFTGVIVVSAIALGSALSRKNNNTQTVSLVSQPTANIQITDQGFVPSDLQVKPGTVVTWTNTTANDYVIDSNPYPTHTSLPGLASTTIPPNGTYEYVFGKTGNWGYQDNLDPTLNGTVQVVN